MYKYSAVHTTTSIVSVQWELLKQDYSLVAAAHGEWSGIERRTGRDSHESREEEEEEKECSALRV